MKRIVLGILFVLFVFSMSTGVFANVGAESDIAVENDGKLLSDSAIDAEILSRINDLYSKIGNTYFNVDHSTGCGKKSPGHGCPNCLLSAIIDKTWFKNIFGSCSVEQFPESYFGVNSHSKNAYSCLGFSHFAQWYIFKESNSDYIYSQRIGTYSFDISNISNYAKIGDNLKLTNSYSSDEGHSAIYMGINSAGTGIEVLDCNYGADYNCMVRKQTLSFTTYNYVTITRTTNRDSIVPNTPPTATLSIDRPSTNYNSGDVVTFTFEGDNNGTYTLGIYKCGERIDTVTVVGNTYSRKFDAGMYSAYMTAYNNVGYTDSNWVEWQVNDLTAYLYVDSESFAQGDMVTLTFDGDNILKYSNGPCTLGIFKDGTHYDTVTVYDEIYKRAFNEAGEYSAYMTAYSETGYKDSNWVYWTVKEWPSAPILKCPDLLYDVNNDLTFEWNDCQKADYYDFWVYQGDEAVHTTCYIEGLSHKLRLPEGTYKAKVASVNKKYSTWTWSNEYEFTVVNDFPERPILSINNIEFESGDDIIISWNNCINADDYDLYIYDKDGNTILTEFYYTQLFKKVALPQGSYTSKIASVNRIKGTWLWSNEVQFTVKEKTIKVPDIDCTVTKCNSLYYTNVVTVNIEDSCEIIVAGYKDNMFVACTSAVDGVASLSGDIDEIRVFAFKDLHKSLSPICDCEVIPSSDFITE